MKVNTRYFLTSVLSMLMAGLIALPYAYADSPPNIKVSAPLNGQKYPAGTKSIQLRGSIEDDISLAKMTIQTDFNNSSKEYNLTGKMVDLANYKINVDGASGKVTVKMVAYDGNNLSRKRTLIFFVGTATGTTTTDNAPTINFNSPADGQKFDKAGLIPIAGSVTDDIGLKTISITTHTTTKTYQVSGKRVDLSKYKFDTRNLSITKNIALIITADDTKGQRKIVRKVISISSDDEDDSKVNQIPVVNFTSPKAGEKLKAGTETVRLSGSVTDDRGLSYLYIYEGKSWKAYRVSGKKIDLSKYSANVKGQSGSVRLSVTARDTNGKFATYKHAVVSIGSKAKVDRAKPVISISSPSNGQTFKNGTQYIQLKGAVTDDVGLQYIYLHNGTRWSYYRVSGEKVDLSKYKFDVRGLKGAKRLIVTARDKAGKFSTYKYINVHIGKKVVDSQKPVVNVTAPTNGEKFKAGTTYIHFKGTVTDDVELQYLYIHNGKQWYYYRVSGKSINLSGYKALVSGMQGNKRLIVTARDKSGKFSPYVYLNYSLGDSVQDTAKPVVKVTSPREGQVIKSGSSSIRLQGTVTDDRGLRYLYIHNGKQWAYYNISGKSVDLRNYKVDVSGMQGRTRIIVAARDERCKLSDYKYIYVDIGTTVIDKQKPVVNVTAPSNGQKFKEGTTSIRLAGTITDDAALRTLYIHDGVKWNYYQVDGKRIDLSKYSVNVTKKSGNMRIIVLAADKTNKYSAPYVYRTVQIASGVQDKQRPVVKLTAPSNGQEFKKGSKQIRLAGSVTDDVELQYLYIHNGSKWSYNKISGKKVDLSRYYADVSGKKGTVRITVAARDKTGKFSVYQSRNVSIGKKEDNDRQRPVVTLTSPKNNFKFKAGTGSIKLTGTVTDDKELLYVYVHDGKKWHNHKVSGKKVDLAKYSVDVQGREGKTQLIVAARDASGKYSIYRYATVFLGEKGDVDNYRPFVDLATPKEGQKFKAGTTSIKLSGVVTDDMALQYLYINNGRSWRAHRISGKRADLSSYSVNVKGLSGNLRLIFTARDKSGKWAKYKYVNVVVGKKGVVDTARPKLIITSPKEGQRFKTGTASIPIIGSATDDVGLEYFYLGANNRRNVHKVSGKRVDLSQFNINTSGMKGNVRLLFGIRDKSGKFYGYLIRNIIIGDGKFDKEKPVVNLTAPGKNQRFELGTTSIQLGGTATDDVGLHYVYVHNSKRWTYFRVDGTNANLSQFKVNVQGLKGNIRLLVFARDKTGKISPYQSVHVTIGESKDKVKPVVNLTSPRNGQKFSAKTSSIQFSGSVTDNVGLQYVYIHDGLRWNNHKVSGKRVDLSQYRIRISKRSGNTRLIVAAQDMAGNYSVYRYANVILGDKGKTDSQSPVVKLNSPHDGQTFKAGTKSIRLTGHVSDDSELEYLYIHNGSSWSISKVSGKKINLAQYFVSPNKTEGEVTIRVKARDKSGNWSSTIQRKITLEKKSNDQSSEDKDDDDDKEDKTSEDKEDDDEDKKSEDKGDD